MKIPQFLFLFQFQRRNYAEQQLNELKCRFDTSTNKNEKNRVYRYFLHCRNSHFNQQPNQLNESRADSIFWWRFFLIISPLIKKAVSRGKMLIFSSVIIILHFFGMRKECKENTEISLLHVCLRWFVSFLLLTQQNVIGFL